MMFLSDRDYVVYTVVIICYKDGKSWREYWQLQRERWTKRETKMIMADLHDKIIVDGCRMVSAKVFYGELANFEYYGELCMTFRVSRFEGGARESYKNVSGSMYNPRKRIIRWWSHPYEVGIH